MATPDFTKYMEFVQECAKAALPAIIAQGTMNRSPERACDLAFSYGRHMMEQAIKFENELKSHPKERASV